MWSSLGAGLEHPIDVATVQGTGGSGPRLAVLAGVHGDEPEGVLAARRLLTRLRTLRFSGSVVIVPTACPSAVMADTRVSAVDNRNLARTFPGSSNGSDTQRIAHLLTEHVIAPASFLIDLHSSGRDYEMPYFVGVVQGEGQSVQRSTAAAFAFGAPLVWLHDNVAPGRSISVAAERGVSALYVECGHGGNACDDDISAYVDGTLRVMQSLGMFGEADAPLPEPMHPTWLLQGSSGNIDEGLVAPFAGWLVPSAVVGAEVDEGAVVAELVSIDGSLSEPIRADRSGAILMIRRTARIACGDLVVLIGPRRLPFDRADPTLAAT